MKLLDVPPGGFRNIAVLRLSSLGDIILTLPVVHALAAAYPDAKIVYWTKEEFGDVLRFDPAIGHVRELERDARRIEDLISMSAELEDSDLIVDLHGNPRTRLLRLRQSAPALTAPSYRLLRSRWVHARWTRPVATPHALARYAEALAPLGIGAGEAPRVVAGEAAEAWARGWIADWGAALDALVAGRSAAQDRVPIALCPAAHHPTKRWIEAHWIALHDRLAGEGYAPIYFSLAKERELFPVLSSRVDADPRARWVSETLSRVAALLSHCAAGVACDTGLMHLAAARGVRVVALFGSTAPELGFAPAGNGHAVLCRHEPCQPCTLHGRASCPKSHFRCMNALEPDQVFAALRGVIGGAAATGGARTTSG